MLLTRGLAEITRLGVSMGAKPLTFAGLAGIGDLILTCTGDLSRNRIVGLKIAEGIPAEKIVSGMKMVAEGIKTSMSAYNLAKKMGIEMPIITEVYNIIYKGTQGRARSLRYPENMPYLGMSMLHESDDNLLPKIIQERLPDSIFTRHIYYFPSIGSTNAYAKALAKKGGAEGSLVIAEKQTEGKGRMGRKWYSPSHVNLYFSVIFRPPFSIDRVFSLNMLIALALVDAIYNITGLKTLIKWPNDVYFKGKQEKG